MAISKSKFNLDDTDLNIDLPIKSMSSKYCQKCGAENEVESKFCQECGNDKFYETYEEFEDKKNSKYCIHCSKKLLVKNKFCPSCGKSDFVSTKEELNRLETKKVEAEWKKRIETAKKELESVKKKEELLKKDNDCLKNQINEDILKYKKEIELINKKIDVYKKDVNYDKNFYLSKIKELTDEKEVYSNDLVISKKKKEEALVLEKDKLASIKKQNQEFEKEISRLSSYLEIKLKEENEKEKIKKLEEEQKEKERKVLEEKEKNKKLNNGLYIDKKKKEITFGNYDGEDLVWKILDENYNEYFVICTKCIDACTKNELSKKLVGLDLWLFNSEERRRLIPIKTYFGTTYTVSVLGHDEVIKYMFKKTSRISDYTKKAFDKAQKRNGLISWWIEDGFETVNTSGNMNLCSSESAVHGIKPVIKIRKYK